MAVTGPRLRDEIDPHLAWLLLLLAPAALLGSWGLAVPLLIPQALICTRVLADPAPGRRRGYLFVNGALVFGSVGLLAALRAVAGRG